MIGARDAIAKFYEKCIHQFDLDSKLADNIVGLTILSCDQLIRNHLYNKNN